MIVRETQNTGDVESLTLPFRPDYLPRDFGQIFVTLVYLHPNAKEDCVKTARNTADNISKIAPSAPHFILGDFNQFNLHKELPNLEQYVTCTTRHDKIRDKCYGNVKGAYRSLQRPPVGSDHNTVYMLPQYVNKLKKIPMEIKTIKVWDSDSIERMRTSLERTDWDVLTEGKNVHETADVLSSYIQFCEEVNVHTKTVRIYPNSKPWITKYLKKQIMDKNRLFAEGKKVEGKIADKEIKKQIRENKLKNKDKVEEQYFSGDVRNAYKGIKALVGKEEVREKGDGRTEEERKEFVGDLNKCYCRFDVHDCTKEKEEICETLEEQAENCVVPEVTEEEVEKDFRNVNPNKACGPDSISGKIIKTFSRELAPVYCDLYNKTQTNRQIPDSWKAATICPVPKRSRPSTLNDYRPIALTSVLMKCLELKEDSKRELDPFQFAYRQNREVEDAVLTLIHKTHSHINNKGSYARILYVDFPSAFNTVQTHLLQKTERHEHLPPPQSLGC